VANEERRAHLIAQAWHLAEEGYTERGVAAKLGISQPTAHRYIEEGRRAAPWVRVLQREEARARKAFRLHLYKEWLIEERKAFGDEALAKDYVPVILQVEDRLAKVEGTDAPKELKLCDLRDLPIPNPQVVEEIALLEQQAAMEEDEIRGAR
jgi:hypothetical protein